MPFRLALVTAAGFNQAEAKAQIPALIGQLKTAASRLPPELSRMVDEAVDNFEGDAASTAVAQINADLTSQVTAVCEGIVDGRYPFSKSPARQVPLSEFAQLFAPDGVLDRFFNANLAIHANMGAGDWTWREDSPLAKKLSLAKPAAVSEGGGDPGCVLSGAVAYRQAGCDGEPDHRA